MIASTLRLFVVVCLVFLLAPLGHSESKATDPDVLALSSLPYSVVQRFIKSELSVPYAIGSQAVNPFYLTGDFDGDGQMDYALRLVSKTNKEKEENAVFFAQGAPRLLSKDLKEDYPGPAWYVLSKNDKEARPSKPKGDCIMMVRPESSSALVFWDGKRFQLSWQGD